VLVDELQDLNALQHELVLGLKPDGQGLVAAGDEAAQAAGVAEAVLVERESGLALKRQAVLFRTGTHSLALELELTRRHIPFVKYGGLRFTEAAHVKDLLALLRWADNPAALLAARRVARLVPGLGPASLQRLLDLLAQGQPLQAFTPPAAGRAPWSALLALMQQLREAPPPSRAAAASSQKSRSPPRRHGRRSRPAAAGRRLAGAVHLYAPVSRFVTPALAARCEASSWPPARPEAAAESAPPCGPRSASAPPQVQGLDFQAALRRPWT
jgi:DNA helicase-2/ATP-dependent DNA helicase PcrA